MEKTEVPASIERPWAVKPLAKATGTDCKTLYAGVARGEIPHVRIGRRILVPGAWVRAKFGRTE